MYLYYSDHTEALTLTTLADLFSAMRTKFSSEYRKFGLSALAVAILFPEVQECVVVYMSIVRSFYYYFVMRLIIIFSIALITCTVKKTACVMVPPSTTGTAYSNVETMATIIDR